MNSKLTRYTPIGPDRTRVTDDGPYLLRDEVIAAVLQAVQESRRELDQKIRQLLYGDAAQ